jgi:beta-glucanase (GH16 family)
MLRALLCLVVLTTGLSAHGEWIELTNDDFESGWGNWADGGVDAAVLSTTNNPLGSPCLNLQDNSGDASSAWLNSSLDLQAYARLKITFSYVTIYFSGAEDFLVEFSADGGVSWAVAGDFVHGSDFTNGVPEYALLLMDDAAFDFTSNVNIRFRCDASGNTDDVYIDDVVISAAVGDSDADGLPDAWELDQFGDLVTSSGGADNYDGDPSSDLEECAAGTSATNPASFFHTPLTFAGGGTFEVSIDAVSNRTYVLQVSETLSPSNDWTYSESIGPVMSNRAVVLRGGVSGDPDRLFGQVQVSEARLEEPSARYVPAGYSFVWGDHFGNNALDPDKWFVGMRDPVTGDLIPGANGDYLLNNKYAGYVTEEDSFVEEGSLILQNQKRSYTGTSPSGSYQYTSGWVTSMHRGHLNKGYIEVRAKFPSGDKVWPAIWLVAEDLVWGPEWDLWEYFGYREDVGYDNMGMHLMTGYEQYGNVWPDQDPTRWNSGWLKPFDALYDAEAWHIYGWEWTDSYAKWYIDGNLVRTLNKNGSKEPSGWPDEEMYIILNNGVRTASPDTTTTWPNRLQIDYIEIYQ